MRIRDREPSPVSQLTFSEHVLEEKKNKFGPARLPYEQLKMACVKVGFDQAELAALDERRGHYPRAAFLRAAGLDQKLKTLPPRDLVTSWATSARVQACLTQINDHAEHLNSLRLVDGQDIAALELLQKSRRILDDFKKFRAELVGSESPYVNY